MTDLKFQPINAQQVAEVLTWHYENPYDMYDMGPADDETLPYFLDPQNAFHAITDQTGELLGFCSFGADGQVPGGDYSTEALDIGLGVRPDLTGQGKGSSFIAAALEFSGQAFTPAIFRVTIADFNRRALRVWSNAGFLPVETFTSTYDGMLFVILIRKV